MTPKNSINAGMILPFPYMAISPPFLKWLKTETRFTLFFSLHDQGVANQLGHAADLHIGIPVVVQARQGGAVDGAYAGKHIDCMLFAYMFDRIGPWQP